MSRGIIGERQMDCDVCGFTYLYSQMRRGVAGKQKGLIVCPPDFDDEYPDEPTPIPRKVPEVR